MKRDSLIPGLQASKANLRARTTWLVMVLVTLLTSPTYAQDKEERAVLKGTVINKSNGQPLKGANVLIQGTYKGASTGEDGEFKLEGIKAGDYTVKVKYLGYETKVINGVSLKKGKTKSLEIPLRESAQNLKAVDVQGKNQLVKLESGKSQSNISQEEIQQSNATNVQDVVSMQKGVTESPDGLRIRGGRRYETQYLIDGVDAQDPLAGTGFGVDAGSGSLQSLEIVTSGVGAEYGNATSGLIKANIREGTDSLRIAGSWQRDNFGFNKTGHGSWNTDRASLQVGTPVPGTDKKLKLFTSGEMKLTDNYFGPTADQLNSSLLNQSEAWAPRQDNSFTNTVKFTYEPDGNTKLSILNQHSLNINQNTNNLNVIGNDEVVTPGFQYPFSNNMDNANTYTHQSNLTTLNFEQGLGKQWWLNVTLGRLFTNLRADANGRPFRPDNVDQVYDPASIITDPVSVFNPDEEVKFVNPPPGLYNNGGIATLWHDHYAREYTFKAKADYIPSNSAHYFSFGWKHQEKEYQWIDVNKPWIGAPIQIDENTTTKSTRLGRSSDVWKVNPATGSFFVSDRIRYKGITANIGARYSYWAPGEFADDAVNNPESPVLDVVREEYKEQSTPVLGRRFKSRFLPRLRVSFPVTQNNVLYFNYTHAIQQPHPRFMYAGLDPAFQDNSFLANLGNPNLNPETTVSYEIGLKSRITEDLALTVSAYYNDKYDYIVSRRISIRDQTGRFTERSFYYNQDYARIRGVEISLRKRFGEWLKARVSGSYQKATGKSNSARESRLQIERTGEVSPSEERNLAWDRPLTLKSSITVTPTENTPVLGMDLSGFRLFLFSRYKSGRRYTPQKKRGVDDNGRPRYESVRDKPLAKIGANWFRTDLKLSKDFDLGNAQLTLSLEINNLFNNRNAQIVNPVTGEGYQRGDPLPYSTRNPEFNYPQNTGLPPGNPARWTEPRHVLYGISFQF